MSHYADSVPCRKCKAPIGVSCMFVHWSSKQRLTTSYCHERIADRRDKVKP